MKKLFALFLTLCMILPVFPVSALEESLESTQPPNEESFETGPGQGFADGVWYDSFEALGVNTEEAPLVQSRGTAVQYDVSEYCLESEHFIINDSIVYANANDTASTNNLTRNISPEIFNLFMERMDMGYEAMLDLTGKAPYNGHKIIITQMGEQCTSACDSPCLQHCGSTIHGAQHSPYQKPMICWNNVGTILTIIAEHDAEDWWFAGTMHELGHKFSQEESWMWDAELWGTYLAWLAIEKLDGRIYDCLPADPTNPVYEGYFDDVEIVAYHVWNPYESRYADYAYFQERTYRWHYNMPNHLNPSNTGPVDMIYALNPVFDELGFEQGWEVFQKVFRSFIGGTYIPPAYPGTGDQMKMADFVDRCSYFSATDIKDTWLPATLTQYENTLIPPTTPYLSIYPRYPRVGDEITISVFNCPAAGTYRSCFIADEAIFRLITKQIPLSVGDNLHISMNYTVQPEDVGKSFGMYIYGLITDGEREWATGTAKVPVPETPSDATVYFMNDFDSLPTQTLPTAGGSWGLPAPYSLWYNDFAGSVCKIASTGRYTGDKALVLSNLDPLQVFRWTDDNGAIKDSSVAKYVYEWDMKITDFSELWRIYPFITVSAVNNGQIEGTTSYWGKLQKNTWAHIAVEVTKATGAYDVYVNKVKVKSGTDYQTRLTFKHENYEHNSVESQMWIDNFTAYSGAYANAIATPPEPSNANWFTNTFNDLTSSHFANAPLAGFLKLPSPYQNYYYEVSGQDVDINLVTRSGNDKALKLTRESGSNNQTNLYRFVDDNTGPGNIHEEDTFTYEMDIMVDNTSTAWSIGFLQDRPYDNKKELALVNRRYWADDNYIGGTAANVWYRIAIEVNSNGTYKVYKNGQVVLSDRSVSFSGDIKALAIYSDYYYTNSGSLYLDNVTAYPGAFRG